MSKPTFSHILWKIELLVSIECAINDDLIGAFDAAIRHSDANMVSFMEEWNKVSCGYIIHSATIVRMQRPICLCTCYTYAHIMPSMASKHTWQLHLFQLCILSYVPAGSTGVTAAPDIIRALSTYLGGKIWVTSSCARFYAYMRQFTLCV